MVPTKGFLFIELLNYLLNNLLKTRCKSTKTITEQCFNVKQLDPIKNENQPKREAKSFIVIKEVNLV